MAKMFEVQILSQELKKKKQRILLNKVRYELIIEKMSEFESNLEKSKGNNLEVLRKKFYFGDDEYELTPESELIAENIEKIKNVIHNVDTTSEEYKKNMEQSAVLKADTKRYLRKQLRYTVKYPYHIDGLVFTPRRSTVGRTGKEKKKNQFNEGQML